MTGAPRDNGLIDYHLSQPDPYEQPTPVTLTGDPALGTYRAPVVRTVTVPPRAGEDDGPAPLAPDRESDRPEVLAAWYSGFAYAEHYRKVVLAQCRELVRARATLDGQKLSEARIDDLARTYSLYLHYLTEHLTGRQRWEALVRADGGLR